MKIRSGIFSDDYLNESKFDWPLDSKAQCGGGVIDNIGKEVFFEVYINTPNTYVRGTGESLQAAEQMAWEKWTSFKDCDHKFKRKFEHSTLGICECCGMTVYDMYEPDSECSVSDCNHNQCSQTNSIDGSVYCHIHYIEKMRKKIEDKSTNDSDVEMYSKIIARLEVLEEIGAFSKAEKDYEFSDIYANYYRNFFDYSIESCKVYQEKMNHKNPRIHYIDILEEIEQNIEIYKSLFTIYLVLNYNFKKDITNHKVKLESLIERIYS